MAKGGLKFIVIALAVAIVAALVMVVFGLARLAPKVASSGADIAVPSVDAGLRQPAGSELVGAALSGGDVAAVVRGGGLPDRIVIVDRATGRVSETIWISDPP